MANSSENVDRYMHELLRRQRRGERITIEIGPHTALALVAAIQWAMRRDAELQAHAPAMFESYLAALRQAFADEPAALAVIQLREPPHESL
jgi:folylpolyglutamate synthase/dihydropteroate synthase